MSSLELSIPYQSNLLSLIGKGIVIKIVEFDTFFYRSSTLDALIDDVMSGQGKDQVDFVKKHNGEYIVYSPSRHLNQ